MPNNTYKTAKEAEHVGKKKLCCPSKIYRAILAEIVKDCDNLKSDCESLKSIIKTMAKEDASGDINRTKPAN